MAPKIFGKNTALQIKCGNAELLIFGNELKGRNREIRYFASGNDHELTEGRLDVLKYERETLSHCFFLRLSCRISIAVC